MISYNIITGDTLTKVFLRIPGGKMHLKNSEWERFIRYKCSVFGAYTVSD